MLNFVALNCFESSNPTKLSKMELKNPTIGVINFMMNWIFIYSITKPTLQGRIKYWTWQNLQAVYICEQNMLLQNWQTLKWSYHPELFWHMRCILTDWLWKTHYFFPKTSFSTLNLIFYYLTLHISRTSCQEKSATNLSAKKCYSSQNLSVKYRYSSNLVRKKVLHQPKLIRKKLLLSKTCLLSHLIDFL